MTQLLLDYDTKDWNAVVKRLMRGINLLGINDFRRIFVGAHVMETGKGYHIRIGLPGEMIPVLVAKTQRILGDDPRRVKLNLQRIRRGVEPWNILFSAKLKLTGERISGETPAPEKSKALNLMLAHPDRVIQEQLPAETREPEDFDPANLREMHVHNVTVERMKRVLK